MLARYPACPSRVLVGYKRVADSGGVEIQKQGISIDDTRAPAIAIPPCFLLKIHPGLRPHRKRIFLVELHRGAC